MIIYLNEIITKKKLKQKLEKIETLEFKRIKKLKAKTEYFI